MRFLFACLQKYAKQRCDNGKLDHAHCSGGCNATKTMSTIELFALTASFGVFSEANKHQNFTRPRPPVSSYAPKIVIFFMFCFKGQSGDVHLCVISCNQLE